MLFVNYKNIFDTPKNAPVLEDVIDQLFVNTVTCFGSDADETEYTQRLVDYLHNDLEAISSMPRKKKCTMKTVEFRDISFRVKQCDSLQAMRNRWELFVLFGDPQDHDVVASCLVHFNDLYRDCEIHEVCVGESGKGYCKELMRRVRHHLSKGKSGPVEQIRIFCENGNPAACKCYSTVFRNARRIDGPIVTSFIYPVNANPASSMRTASQAT